MVLECGGQGYGLSRGAVAYTYTSLGAVPSEIFWKFKVEISQFYTMFQKRSHL